MTIAQQPFGTYKGHHVYPTLLYKDSTRHKWDCHFWSFRKENRAHVSSTLECLRILREVLPASTPLGCWEHSKVYCAMSNFPLSDSIPLSIHRIFHPGWKQAENLFILLASPALIVSILLHMEPSEVRCYKFGMCCLQHHSNKWPSCNCQMGYDWQLN